MHFLYAFDVGSNLPPYLSHAKCGIIEDKETRLSCHLRILILSPLSKLPWTR